MSEKEEPIVDNTVEKQKIKKKPAKKFSNQSDTVKVDLSKPKTEEAEETVAKVDLSEESKQEVEESSTDDTRVVGSDESSTTGEKQEEVQPEGETQAAVLEEITEEAVAEVEEKVEEAIAEAVETGKPLPENIQKLVDFMEETGGNIQDYVELNRDYSDLDNMTALQEYYKKTKPHLSPEELAFMLEDKFSYDDEVDDEKDIMRKKLALKEEVADAKKYLEDQKTKYYDEIKAGSRLTPEAQKAMDFFNRYNKEAEANKVNAEKQRKMFDQKTNNLFTEEFKGFEFNVGDKKFRYNVKNAQEVKNTQSDINNFVKKFLAEDGTMSDAQGYHKSLFTAMNADAIAQHFYEQGKADATKSSIASSKNVDMQPRQSHGEINLGGMKYRVVSGDSSNDFKIRSKKRK